MGLLEKTLSHLPYAAALVRLRDPQSQLVETVAAKGFDTKERLDADTLSFVDGIMKATEPLIVRNVFADTRFENLAFFKKEGLVSIIGLPLVANHETLGCLVYAAREEHGFGAEEVEFLDTLAGQAAMAIHHSQLYRQSQQQTEELRHAHKIKDEFLKVVSNELRTPLSVISRLHRHVQPRIVGPTDADSREGDRNHRAAIERAWRSNQHGSAGERYRVGNSARRRK